MPKGIIDGFYEALTIGLIPTLAIVLFKLGNLKHKKDNKNNHGILVNLAIIVLGFLFAFSGDRKR